MHHPANDRCLILHRFSGLFHKYLLSAVRTILLKVCLRHTFNRIDRSRTLNLVEQIRTQRALCTDNRVSFRNVLDDFGGKSVSSVCSGFVHHEVVAD